jgi:hypothetical protein
MKTILIYLVVVLSFISCGLSKGREITQKEEKLRKLNLSNY